MAPDVGWFIQEPERYDELDSESQQPVRDLTVCKIIVDADSEVEITHFGGEEAAVKLAESIVAGGHERAGWTLDAPRIQEQRSMRARIPPVRWSICRINADPQTEIQVRHRHGVAAVMRLARAIMSGRVRDARP